MAGLIPLLLAGGSATNFQDGALAATGTSTVAFAGAEIQSAAPVAMTGTGTASFVGVDATPVVVTTPSAATAGGAGTWSGYGRKKKRKKQEALDELDILLAAVKAQVEPWENAKAYAAEQAIYRDALKSAAGVDMSSTLAKIESEIVNLKELLAERDDEETILLLLQ